MRALKSYNFQFSNLRVPHPSLDFLRFTRAEEPADDTNFTAIVSTPITIDLSVFHGYLHGSSIAEIVATLQTEPDMQEAPTSAIAEYVKGQMYLFQHIEYFLHRPRYFLEQQHMLPLSMQARMSLIERYYMFDEPVMLELLGRKLTSRTRTALPEVAARANIAVASCRRQFENAKRIAKQVEDVEGVSLATEIMQKFALPEELANQYTHILFLTINRIDTTKRCLAHFSFSDFDFCARTIIELWTSPASTMTLDSIDADLTAAAQQLKGMLVDDRERFDALFASLRQAIQTPGQPLVAILENRNGKGLAQVRTVMRSSFAIVAGLATTSTLRNVLGLIVEKIVDAFVALGLRSEDMVVMYNAFVVQATRLLGEQHGQDTAVLINALERSLTGIRLLGCRLFRYKPSLFDQLNKIRPT
ncbi:hypothetical protein EC988_005942 [Linderina pennispora]|nr:hypothetical protein EC988_005942 [Linderina pennispora]